MLVFRKNLHYVLNESPLFVVFSFLPHETSLSLFKVKSEVLI